MRYEMLVYSRAYDLARFGSFFWEMPSCQLFLLDSMSILFTVVL